MNGVSLPSCQPQRARVRASGWVAAFVLCLSGPAWSQNGAAPLGTIQRNFPEPFSRRTAIPFEVLPIACAGDEQPVVTIQILNVLVQAVASPTLGEANGAQISSLPLDCGRYLAFWDRSLAGSDAIASPGSYFYRLFVNGESQGVLLMQVRGEVVPPVNATP